MQKLIQSGVNCITKELEALIPKFKPGEVKVFQLLGGIPNNDPDMNERQKQPVLYGHRQIPTKDRIKDLDGNFVEIAVVEQFDTKTGALIKPRLFVPNMGMKENPGTFILAEGNLEHEELYEYLAICNYNESCVNPNRNKNVEALFFEIKQDDSIFVQPKRATPTVQVFVPKQVQEVTQQISVEASEPPTHEQLVKKQAGRKKKEAVEA